MKDRKIRSGLFILIAVLTLVSVAVLLMLQSKGQPAKKDIPSQTITYGDMQIEIKMDINSDDPGKPVAKAPAYKEYAQGDHIGVFGWDGDKDAAIAFENGSFEIRDSKNIIVGFNIFNSPKTLKWYNHSGYLPCLVTEFERDSCTVKIMNFGDKVNIANNDYVIAYSRVSVTNNDTVGHSLYPLQSEPFIPISEGDGVVLPNETKNFDFAIAIDRFGNLYPWPDDAAVKAAGGWDEHFSHMKNYWDDKLSEIAQLSTPDEQLNNAYKAGFVYTHIVKDGNSTNVGENGYDRVYDHDADGILANLLTIGYFSEAKDFLDRLPVGSQYNDATWKYPWPWALYLMKTGDVEFVRSHFDTIKESARRISEDRTGPGGIMKLTPDIDSNGYWTVDNWSGLTGLLSYRYICSRLGESDEMKWADSEYKSFLNAVNTTLSDTIAKNNLNYLPVSMIEPNDSNRTGNPLDANWAAQFFFGRWAWDGWLLGGDQNGVSLDLIDSTYDYGFKRLSDEKIPPHTFGAYPGLSTGYNVGYCGAALRGERYRTEGIKAYEYIIENTQSGPFSWWESVRSSDVSTWEGKRGEQGAGSCPHMWGQSAATKVLIESIAAEFYDGKLLVGRGIPDEWLSKGKIELNNFPLTNNRRINIEIQSVPGKITLTLSGDEPENDIIFNLPAFTNHIASVSTGTFDNAAGTVTLPRDTKTVTVVLN